MLTPIQGTGWTRSMQCWIFLVQ